jgi:hypothetical protein
LPVDGDEVGLGERTGVIEVAQGADGQADLAIIQGGGQVGEAAGAE